MKADNPRRTQRTKALTLAAMSLGYGVVQLDVTIVNTAIASMGASLGGGVSALQWIVSTYTIAFAALILTGGAIGDRYGAKRIFLFGFALFTAASLGCALAPSPAVLIAFRALQGLAAAVLVPNSLALLNHAYPDETERGRAIGYWAAGATIALAAGPLAGGVLVEIAGWRSIFLVNLPLGLAALWLTARYARETPSHEHKLDLPGQIAAIAGLGVLAGTLIEGGRIGWTRPWVLAGFAAAIAAAAVFIGHERKTREPMLPLSLFQNPMFSLTTAAGLLVNIAFYGLIFVLSLYFQQVNRWSALATGLAFLPMMAAVLPANLVAPRLAERIGAPATIAIGALITAAGVLGLLVLKQGTAYAALAVQLIAMGAGLGLLVPPLTSTLLGSVEKTRSGIASGVLNSSRQTGSVIGVSLFGALLGSAFVPGAHASLWISAALLAASAALFRLAPTSVPSRPDSRR